MTIEKELQSDRLAPSKHEIRAVVASFASSSGPTALIAIALDLSLYFGLLVLCTKLANPLAKAVCSFALGVVIVRLFVLGHDAGHGCLLPGKRMNNATGRLMLLLTGTPFSLWQLGHNTIHHGFTNLLGRDAVWPPYSPAEFRRLPRYRQTLERFYRSPAGLGAYYAVELWWKKLFFPSRHEVRVHRRSYAIDSFLVVLYFAALAATVTPKSHSRASAAGNILFAVVLPMAVFFWLMGFTIFLHHTHPAVRWFANRSEWTFAESQLAGTVHNLFPRWMNYLFHNIYDHTAHHIDVRIPFYRLHEAQVAVESVLGTYVVVEKFCLKSFIHTLRACALYDYDQNRWVSFEGIKGKATTMTGEDEFQRLY
jgi:omega-6 fatty acid desaturase (delta-12 desaturase)